MKFWNWGPTKIWHSILVDSVAFFLKITPPLCKTMFLGNARKDDERLRSFGTVKREARKEDIEENYFLVTWICLLHRSYQ